ncbi:MAG: hypothetical protein ABIG11_09090 [bacterium]
MKLFKNGESLGTVTNFKSNKGNSDSVTFQFSDFLDIHENYELRDREGKRIPIAILAITALSSCIFSVTGIVLKIPAHLGK